MPLPYRFSREYGPPDSLLQEFWPQEQGDNTFLLFLSQLGSGALVEPF